MLSSVKNAIDNLPKDNKPFKRFYQEYVVSVSDSIVSKDIKNASHSYKTIEDICPLVDGINRLMKGLK